MTLEGFKKIQMLSEVPSDNFKPLFEENLRQRISKLKERLNNIRKLEQANPHAYFNKDEISFLERYLL